MIENPHDGRSEADTFVCGYHDAVMLSDIHPKPVINLPEWTVRYLFMARCFTTEASKKIQKPKMLVTFFLAARNLLKTIEETTEWWSFQQRIISPPPLVVWYNQQKKRRAHWTAVINQTLKLLVGLTHFICKALYWSCGCMVWPFLGITLDVTDWASQLSAKGLVEVGRKLKWLQWPIHIKTSWISCVLWTNYALWKAEWNRAY